MDKVILFIFAILSTSFAIPVPIKEDSRNIIKVIPSGSHYNHLEEEHHAPAEYEFNYSVHDEHTGDIKSHQESRKGDVVVGRYELIDADGFHRIVEYHANPHEGFVASVRREPTDFKIPINNHQSTYGQKVLVPQIHNEQYSRGHNVIQPQTHHGHYPTGGHSVIVPQPHTGHYSTGQNIIVPQSHNGHYSTGSIVAPGAPFTKTIAVPVVKAVSPAPINVSTVKPIVQYVSSTPHNKVLVPVLGAGNHIGFGSTTHAYHH